MALSARVDLTKTPIELSITSDRRKVSVEVTAAGETATATGTFPVKITDSSGRTWTPKSDDGITAVFTG